jgi:hypothetical protein
VRVEIKIKRNTSEKPYTLSVDFKDFPDKARGLSGCVVGHRGGWWVKSVAVAAFGYVENTTLYLPGIQKHRGSNMAMTNFKTLQEARETAKNIQPAIRDWEKKWKAYQKDNDQI